MREPYRQLLDEAEAEHARPAQALREASAPRRRRGPVLALAAGAAALALVVGLAALKLTEPPPMCVLVAAPDPAPEIDVLSRLAECRTYSDIDGVKLDWQRALEACKAVLALDPINTEARKLKKVAEKELAQQRLYDEGRRLVAAGREEDALETFLKIDKDSYYLRLARVEFKQAAPLVQKRAAEQCSSGWKRQAFDRAWLSCRTFMDMAYYLNNAESSPEFAQAKTAFDDLAKQMKGKDEWRPRADYAIYLPSGCVLGPDRGSEIRQMYKDPELAAAVAKFAMDPVLGMNLVQRYIGKGGKDAARAKQVFKQMEAMYSASQVGNERLLKGELDAAAPQIQLMLKADAAIMPQGLSSDRAKELRREIARKYASKGKEQFTMGHLPESFEQCSRAGEFALGDPNTLECFSDLEKVASEKAASGCDDANLALRITREQSPTHKRAAEFVSTQCR